MSFGGELNPRVQILLSLKADNEGVAQKAAAEIERLENAIKASTQSMVTNQMGVGPWITEYQKLNREIEKWTKVLVDAKTAAEAPSDAAIREADAWSKVVIAHAEAMDKMDADTQSQALKEEAVITKKIDKWMASADVKVDSSAKATQKEAELLDKQVTDAVQTADKMTSVRESENLKELEMMAEAAVKHGQFLDREEAQSEAKLQKDAEMMAEYAVKHGQFLDREEAQDEAKLQKDAEMMAEAAVKHGQFLDREEAQSEAKMQGDLETMAEYAAQHERFLEREAAKEKQLVADIIDSRNALMAQRAREGKQLETQSAGLVKVLGPINAGMEQAGEGAKKFSYGMLHVAHAIQDAQYGFGAVLNNIPLVAQALGMGPGLAGTVMIAGVAASVLTQNVGGLGVALGIATDPANRFGASMEDAQAKLKALTEKPWKMEMDYQAIEVARTKLEMLQKMKAAFEATEETSEEKAYVEAMKKMIDKAGGALPLGKAVLEDALQRGFRPGDEADYSNIKEAQKNIDFYSKRRGTLSLPFELINEDLIRRAQASKAASEKAIEEAKKAFVFQRVGGMAAGDETELKIMQDLARRKPGAFTGPARRAIAEMPTKREFGEERMMLDLEKSEMDKADFNSKIEKGRRKFVEGLQKESNQKMEEEWDAMTESPEHKAQLKIVDEKEKQIINAVAKRKSEIAATAAMYGAEFAKQHGPRSLEQDITRSIAHGDMPDVIKGGLTERMTARLAASVPEERIDEVVSQILDKAIAKAQSRIGASGIGGDQMEAARGLVMEVEEKAADVQERAGAKEQREAMQAAEGPGRAIAQQQKMAGHMLGADIEAYDPTIGHAAAMRAGAEAAALMRRQVPQQTAMWAAYMSVMDQLVNGQVQMGQRIQDLMMQINGFQGKMGAQRTMRPGMMPTMQIN